MPRQWHIPGGVYLNETGRDWLLGAQVNEVEVGTALSFVNASGSYLSRTSGAAPTAPPLTWMMWAQEPAATGNFEAYFMQTASVSSFGTYFFLGLDLSVPPKFQPDRNTLLNNTVVMPVGSWTHLAITIDGSGNYVIYLNGVSSATGSGMTVTVGDCAILGGDPIFNNWTTADLTALKIWNAELSGAEVLAERDYYAPQRTADLWAWWSLRDTTAQEIADRSGNGRDWVLNGTIGNAPGPPVEWDVEEAVVVGVLNTSIMPPTGSRDGASLRHP